MKWNELKPIELECNMGKDVNGVEHREPWKAYDIDEVDALVAEKDKEIAELEKKLAEKESWVKMLGEGEATLSLELEKTKQKLENVQASMYCDVVDANMENRRLKRALWIARAKRAFDCKEIFRIELRINELKQTYVGSGYYMVMINKWQNVERKCLKKAEDYK